MGVYEMLGCIGVRKKPEITIPTLIYTAGICMTTRFIVQKSGSVAFALALISVCTFILMYYLMALSVFSKGSKSIIDTAMVLTTTLYITIGFDSIQILRDIDLGYVLLYLVFVGAWAPDGGGYFFGRAFGKHKLIPDVSPNKTVEGAIGGIFSSVFAFLLYGFIIQMRGIAMPQYLNLALAGLFLSVLSILGDLIASLIKRHYEIKDYGKLFPGHGGVLDRFDSIIAVAPFLLMLCSYPEVFTLFKPIG